MLEGKVQVTISTFSSLHIYYIVLYYIIVKRTKPALYKLDGTGPALLITDPPPISFTNLSKKRQKIEKNRDMWHMTYNTWHMTYDMWHVTCDVWNVTCDMWHVTCDTWNMTCDMLWRVNILSKFQLPSSYCFGFMILWRSRGKGWLN